MCVKSMACFSMSNLRVYAGVAGISTTLEEATGLLLLFLQKTSDVFARPDKPINKFLVEQKGTETEKSGCIREANKTKDARLTRRQYSNLYLDLALHPSEFSGRYLVRFCPFLIVRSAFPSSELDKPKFEMLMDIFFVYCLRHHWP